MEIQFKLALISIEHLLISFDLICLIVLQYQLLQDNTLQKKVLGKKGLLLRAALSVWNTP